MKTFLLILLALLCIGCKQNARSQSVAVSENSFVRIDTIPGGIRHTFYNKEGVVDSIMMFNSRTSFSLMSIRYYNHPQGIRSKHFSTLDGYLRRIRWEHDNPQRGDTIAMGFFRNGNIRRISFYRDKDNSFSGDTIEISYFASGKLSEITIVDDNNQLRTKRFHSSTGTLSDISFAQGDTIMMHFFPNGNVSGIEFYRSEDNARRGDTISISYFESGKPEVVVTLVNDWFPFPQLQTFFFECGQIRMQGVHDSFNVTSLPVGLWKTFDSSGALIRTDYFHPSMEEGEDFIIVEEFSDGKLISRRKYNNHVQNESDPTLREQLY